MINLEWVKDYIDISDQDLNELAKKITEAGINVEKVITNHIDNLVVGEVVECENIEESDHLHLTKVDIGSDKLQIVCGAPNVKKGIKVIVAKVGAKLPNGVEIKKSKICGKESNGMLCALFELGLEEKNDETYAKGIYILDDKCEIGEDPFKYLGSGDTLYELDIHKHRNNDCYHHIGFAYEIGAILNRKVNLPEIKYNEVDDSINGKFDLEVKTDKCPYFVVKIVKNLKLGESPEFIKRRLASVGIRSINNIVDISNYIMMEYGQPLHFYDYDKLGKRIVVRDAIENEKVRTLNHKELTLTKNDIVITNGEIPVGVAGVMGGENTEVDDNTKTVLIEAALFDPISIRNTSARLNLRSEASTRFGKGITYEYTDYALDRACELLEKYASGEVLKDKVIHDKVDKTKKIVEFIPDDVNKLLGMNISIDDMKNELKRLDFDYELKDNKFIVTIPNRRMDIDPYVNDIAEEIGRLYGYNNLKSTLTVSEIKKGEYKGDVKYRKIISKRLRKNGLNEVHTYNLVNPDMTKIFKYNDKVNLLLPNPMSIDKSVLRTTLIPSLLNVYNYNNKRKVNNIRLYEIAKTYDINYNEESLICGLLQGEYLSNGWGNKLNVDFYLVKGIVEDILNYLGFNGRYEFIRSSCSDLHPGISADILLDNKKIGIIGRVHPSIEKDDVYVFELSLQSLMVEVDKLKYVPAPIYPSIEKDMAFILDKDITSKQVIDTIKKYGGELLKTVNVFDVYEGKNIDDNKKSIAFNLSFSSNERTLTDEEVMDLFNNIIDKVSKEFNAEIRDK